MENPGGGLGGPGGAGPSGPSFEGFQRPSGGLLGSGPGSGTPGGGLAGGDNQPGGGLPGGGPGNGDPGNGGPGGGPGSGTPGAGLPGGGLPGGGPGGEGGPGFFSGTPLNLGGFGGFGTVTGGPAPIPGEEEPSLPGHWQPGSPPYDSGEVEWPDLPTLYEDLDPAIVLQEEAQEAAENAGENAQEAAEAAQDAYNELWDDYYAAVDYAAQAYYEAMTATADEVYELYAYALEEAYQVVDYVYDNYENYATYCFYYPWDCYAYAYDAATGTYTTTQVTNNYYYYYGEDEAGAEPAPAPPSEVSPEQVPEPSAEAYEALVIFANDQLGLAVNPLYAGELTVDVLTLLSYLPAEVQDVVAAAPDVSAETYWGLLSGGAATVSVGDCSPDAPCTLSGEMEVDLSAASLGVYALHVGETLPADASAALDLVELVYPKLEGIAFAPVEQEGMMGYAFYAVTTGLGLDADGKPLAVTKAIYAGVVPAGEVTVVYAAVGVGSYSAILSPLE